MAGDFLAIPEERGLFLVARSREEKRERNRSKKTRGKTQFSMLIFFVARASLLPLALSKKDHFFNRPGTRRLRKFREIDGSERCDAQVYLLNARNSRNVSSPPPSASPRYFFHVSGIRSRPCNFISKLQTYSYGKIWNIFLAPFPVFVH